MKHLVPPAAGKVHRLVFLDGIRGWAALIVVLSHIMFQFLGKTNEVYNHLTLSFFVNGSFAVYVFFVLSGFALTIKFIEKPGYYSVAQAACSRYFRLSIPIFVVSVLAYLLLKFGLFFNKEAAIPAKSIDWLGWQYNFEATIRSLFEFSFYKVFFKYDELTGYNSSLWTMPIEWIGSILMYFIIAVFISEKDKKVYWLPIFLIGLYFFRFNPPLLSFVLGYFLAELYHRYRDNDNRLINIAATGLFFLPVLIIALDAPKRGRYTALLAMILVGSVMFSKPLKKIFSSRLSEFMGQISFPLYLIHILVICSFSSYLFLVLPEQGYSHLMMSNIILGSTVTLSILLAWMLLPVERFSVFAARSIATKALKLTAKR